MAVTIHSTPQEFTPSDNPIIWSFSSNQTGQPNFSYIVELRVDTVLVGSHQLYPEIGARTHFNASEVLRSLLNVPNINQTLRSVDAANWSSVYIKIREFYGTTPAFQSYSSSPAITVFKSSLSNKEFQNWDWQDYIIGVGNKFLTDAPNDLQVRVGTNYFAQMFYYGLLDLYVIFNDIDGNMLTFVIHESTVAAGVVQFNLNTDLYVTEITQGVLDQTHSISFKVLDHATSTYQSEIKTFYLNRDCLNGYPLYWLNKYGCFDTFDFNHNASYSSDIKSFSYEKQFGSWLGTAYTFDSSNSGAFSYLKTATDKVTLTSTYLDQAHQNWLVSSCYISPLVYIYDSSYDRVSIDNTSYILNQDRFIEEYTENVTITLPNIRKSVVI